ncbi:tyrosine-type recombinase/integrase [Jeotgalibaca porci]|uniref:tyrosine-type recombinase/integrase n=1 Tax=Jeotgalibaca porci TaxID=1868793 RepID=UPI0035A051C5
MKGTIRKRGKNYYYTVELPKIDGKRRQMERYAGETYAEAQETLRHAINELKDTGRFKNVSKISFVDYSQHWFDNYVMMNLKYNTQQNYRGILDNHIIPHLKNYYLMEIDAPLLQKLVHNEFQKGLAQKTMSIIISVLRNMFRKAVYPYIFLKENPMAYVEAPRFDSYKPTKEELKIIPAELWIKLQVATPEASDFYIPMMIAYYTGMRRGEICALEWKNVDLVDQVIKVEKTMYHKKKEIVLGSPKTKSSLREVTIGDALTKILRKHRKRQMENRLRYGKFYSENEFVCTKDSGDVVTPNSIKWNVDKTRKLTDVDFNFHSFRHTHATMLLEAGASVKEVQVRLGHSRSSITQDTYLHLTEKKKRDTAELFDRISGLQ